MNRRRFVELGLMGAAGAGLNQVWAKETPSSQHFFSVIQKGGRHWLQDPQGNPFWSIGMNHVDPATLRYIDSGDVWNEEFGNSMQRWLKTVREDLTEWGFNSLGWNQEAVIWNDQNRSHSRSFTFEEYQWLEMPHCHLLPFIESHQWEVKTRLPDLRSKGFADWCDYVARDQCARMKHDPNLIGYFFTDCPTWIHSSDATAWKAPLFDPDMLKTPAGKRELRDLATAYYRITTEAIKRYDPNHLILGDRYDADRPIAEEVLAAAQPYVDVYSFQCFADAKGVQKRLGQWADLFPEKPILLADNARWHPTEHSGWPPKDTRHIDPAAYAEIMQTLQAMPQCIGYHLCGAYLRNKTRRYGLKDNQNQLAPSTAAIAAVNESARAWATGF